MICKRCGVDKLPAHFIWGRTGMLRHGQQCRDCYKRRTKEKHSTPERQERDRMLYVKRVYGISAEEYDALLAKQNGKCAICGKEGKLIVDHCHSTNKVRGLLCYGCNIGIGFIDGNLDKVYKAIEYLDIQSKMKI